MLQVNLPFLGTIQSQFTKFVTSVRTKARRASKLNDSTDVQFSILLMRSILFNASNTTVHVLKYICM